MSNWPNFLQWRVNRPCGSCRCRGLQLQLSEGFDAVAFGILKGKLRKRGVCKGSVGQGHKVSSSCMQRVGSKAVKRIWRLGAFQEGYWSMGMGFVWPFWHVHPLRPLRIGCTNVHHQGFWHLQASKHLLFWGLEMNLMIWAPFKDFVSWCLIKGWLMVFSLAAGVLTGNQNKVGCKEQSSSVLIISPCSFPWQA